MTTVWTKVSDKQVGIRRALAIDAGALNRIRSETSGLFTPARDLERHLAEPDIYTYLAEDDAPFGFVTVGPVTDLEQDGLGEVREWFVSPTYQQHGYGRKLLVHGLTVLKRRMCDSALIWLPVETTRPLDVVLKHGFKAYPAERVVNVGELSRTEQAYLKDLGDYF
jgi:ribosomal protein S18 acetylase RimI-like enzyme